MSQITSTGLPPTLVIAYHRPSQCWARDQAVPIHQQLFDSDLEGRIRAALSARFPFLLHQTSRHALHSIVRDGLLPRVVTPAADADRDFLQLRFGTPAPPVVCLANPSRPVAYSVADNGETVQLAVDTAGLHHALYLDWTFGNLWNLVGIIAEDDHCDAERVLPEILERGRSVVVCEAIRAENLRVRLRDSAPGPDTWPQLSTEVLEDVWIHSPLRL